MRRSSQLGNRPFEDSNAVVKLLYTSDLHGETALYAQLEDLVAQEQPVYVLLGGDLFAEDWDPHKAIGHQYRFGRDFLAPFCERLKHQRGAQEIFWLLGNHDLASLLPLLAEWEGRGLCQLLHGRTISLPGGWRLWGYPFSPPSPFQFKDLERQDRRASPVEELCLLSGHQGYISQGSTMVPIDTADYFRSQPTIEEDLACFVWAHEPQRSIFVFHAPPYRTHLDLEKAGLWVGSAAIKDFLRRHRPRLSFHGHLHQSPVLSGSIFDWVGETLCLNPGQEAGRLHAVLVDPTHLNSVTHTVWGKIPISRPTEASSGLT